MAIITVDNPSRNEELLRRVYDPGYIRRVAIARPHTPVQVCLDSRMLGVRATGVATYAAVLAHCLPAAGATPMVLYQDDPAAPAIRSRTQRWLAACRIRARTAYPAGTGPGAEGAHALVCADLFREAQVFFNLHRRLMPVSCPEPPRVMHWTYPVPLYLEGALNVYTVHDAIPLTHPHLTPIPPRRHRDLLERIAERAHRIVTVSEAARAEIAHALGLNPGGIVSLSQAVHIPLQQDPPLPAGLAAGGYFLCCGAIEPRKNLVAIAQAHAQSGSRLPLLIVGPPGWRAQEICRALAAFPEVRVLPWQERHVLIGLIRRARALVLASLAEGFGLPIIEAMTLGTPVITSDLAATAEVAGGAALLVDPTCVSDIATALARLSHDADLTADLRRRGFAWAHHFTPDRYAVRLRDFYAGLAEAAQDGQGAGTGREARG